jgi:RNA ligase (TIGR02306 family)
MSDFHPCVVKIQKIEKHPNADTLSIATVMNEYPVVIKTGQYNVGDLVSYLPADSVVPDNELFHFLAPAPKKDKQGNITKSFNVGEVPVKFRTIKAKQIRNVYSEGLLMESPPGFQEGDSVIEHFGLTKRVYEEEEPELNITKGSNENEKDPKTFKLFKYDLEGLAKYGYAFEEGEEVVILEKLEGENCTIIYAEDKLWVRSRNYFKRNGYTQRVPYYFWDKVKFYANQTFSFFKNLFVKANKNVVMSHWWEVPIRLDLATKLQKYPRHAFWGELIGGVRGWQYDCQTVNGSIQREFRVFDIFNVDSRKFLEWSEVETICNDLELSTVPVLYKGPWKNDRSLHDLAEGKSTIGSCIREGFVMKSVPESYHPKLGRKIIKLKGREYKLVKG